jgi:catechol 2,3-dioxygenase-like lactoylglutathione lyase family enzyme
VTWGGNLDGLLDHLVRMDVAVLTGPVPRYGARGLGQSVYVRDPDGSLIEFIVYA